MRPKAYVPSESKKGRQIRSQNNYTPRDVSTLTKEQIEWNKQVELKKEQKKNGKA